MTTQQSYQVLARKYRPSNFEELIGQEVLVQTLINAIENKKIAHSFILTGIRGVGKTTTARIIAKALNCIGEDGLATEARKPCAVCSNCLAIAASRHQDVIEIDAASKTGVDDMRNIIDSILYAPAIGRYKVYIIDEVHMLSNSAFNALLKTLEEPPAHIKFIFATTEIRKVPITVLSRCQRFDLRRLSSEELAVHLKNILGQEGFEIENEGCNFIADAADGSVRDLLSITDRILSHNNYQKTLTTSAVAEVLGLNDKNKIIDLLATILAGDITKSLQLLEKFYENSTDISNLIIDLQKITHITTLVKTVDNYQPHSLSETAKQKIIDLAAKASLVDLTRIWQMLLKGSVELANSASQKMVLEMLLIRMCYLADLPNLEQIIAKSSSATADSNIPKTDKNLSNQDLAGEIMRNFSEAKIVS
jgi:DNA polymerase-3 subunit gamma/tau